MLHAVKCSFFDGAILCEDDGRKLRKVRAGGFEGGHGVLFALSRDVRFMSERSMWYEGAYDAMRDI